MLPGFLPQKNSITIDISRININKEKNMAKIIDDETMENVCILAKLSLSEEEKEKAKAEMQKMLDYVEKLDELDTSEVEPLF